MHGSASLAQQSIQCGRDLLWATPQLQLLLRHNSRSGSTVNAPFDHPPDVAGRPKILMQHLAYLPRTSTSMQKPQSPGGYDGYDQS
jgi:hypothetical protein